MTVVLALDVGTSWVKAAIVTHGRVGIVAERPLSVEHPADGHVEQEPDHWWDATVEAVRALRGDGVTGVDVIAVTGQMQDLIALNARGRPVRPAVLYADTRATVEHAELQSRLGSAWSDAIGAAPDATNLAAKWRWLQRHEPHSTAATSMVLVGAHAAVAHRLTGVPASDPTTAATTGLYHLAEGSWWQPVCTADAPVVPPIPLPSVVAPTRVLGRALAEAADELGVAAGTPVVLATGDAVATTLGVVGTAVDMPYAYVGTSGWVAVATDIARPGPGVIVLPGLDVDHWISTAPLVTGGAAIDWVRATLLGDMDHERFDRLAASTCAGEDGVILWPHLDGLRSPHPDALATGVMVGVRRSTTSATIAAAALEGVAHALRAIAEAVTPHTGDLALCGGASRSDVMTQVLADVTGRTVHRVVDEHAAVRGAAICAHAALGAAPLPAADRLATFTPRAAQRRAHERLAPVFDALAGALGTTFASLADVRSHRRSSRSVATDDHEGETSP
jgi:xylulokinase